MTDKNTDDKADAIVAQAAASRNEGSDKQGPPHHEGSPHNEDTPNKDGSGKPARRIPRMVFIGGATLFLALAVAAAYFANFRDHPKQQASGPSCQQAETRIAKLKPMATGTMAGWKFPEHPVSFNQLAFIGPDNQKISLAAFSGRTILLNLWASWCAPCREEMPSLDKVQALQGSPTFSVVALNTETFRPERGKAFLAQLGANSLPFYSDPSGEAMATLKQQGKALMGLPVTLLLDGEGCELASFAGPGNWGSEEATSFLQAAQ